MMAAQRHAWHILGAGAIGCLFAWHLDKAGIAVRFITRQGSESGKLVSLEEDGQIETKGFLTDHSSSPITRLLVAVKAHQTEAALAAIRHRINANTTIVLLQNGIGTQDIVRRLTPEAVCLLATTTEGANRTSDQHLIHAGRGHTWVGTEDLSQENRARQIVNEWGPIRLPVSYDAQIEQRLWSKLAINCAINPLTVIYDCNNGHLLDLPRAREQIQRVCDEVTQVRAGVVGSAPPNLYEMVCDVARKTADNVSSMLQDYRRGKPTEIDFITGYIVNQAAKLGIPALENEKILTTIKQLYN